MIAANVHRAIGRNVIRMNKISFNSFRLWN